MLFLFPIGLYTYFVIEKKTKKEYQLVFDDFQKKIVSNRNLTVLEKKSLFEQMLLQNGYRIIEMNNDKVIGEKKVLSMAFMMMGLGIYIVGLFFYLIYYFWFQKPHKVEFYIH
jgi:hypothetical protein